MGSVMIVHNVEQVDVAVRGKLGIQRKAEQAKALPIADFAAQIDDRNLGFDAIVDEPNTPVSFLDKRPPGGVKGQSDGLIPVTGDFFRGKIRRKCLRGGRRRHGYDQNDGV